MSIMDTFVLHGTWIYDVRTQLAFWK